MRAALVLAGLLAVSAAEARIAPQLVRHPSDTDEQFNSRAALQWQQAFDQSPVDGRRVTESTRSPHFLVQDGWRGRRPSLEMVVACVGREIQLVFASDHLIAGHRMRTTLRIGQDLINARLRQSADGRGAGFWGASARPVLERILRADELAVRITHDVFGTTEAIYDIRGAREATARVREACPAPAPRAARPAAQPARPPSTPRDSLPAIR